MFSFYQLNLIKQILFRRVKDTFRGWIIKKRNVLPKLKQRILICNLVLYVKGVNMLLGSRPQHAKDNSSHLEIVCMLLTLMGYAYIYLGTRVIQSISMQCINRKSSFFALQWNQKLCPESIFSISFNNKWQCLYYKNSWFVTLKNRFL